MTQHAERLRFDDGARGLGWRPPRREVRTAEKSNGSTPESRSDFRDEKRQHQIAGIPRSRALENGTLETRPIEPDLLRDGFASERSIRVADEAHEAARGVPEHVP